MGRRRTHAPTARAPRGGFDAEQFNRTLQREQEESNDRPLPSHYFLGRLLVLSLRQHDLFDRLRSRKDVQIIHWNPALIYATPAEFSQGATVVHRAAINDPYVAESVVRTVATQLAPRHNLNEQKYIHLRAPQLVRSTFTDATTADKYDFTMGLVSDREHPSVLNLDIELLSVRGALGLSSAVSERVLNLTFGSAVIKDDANIIDIKKDFSRRASLLRGERMVGRLQEIDLPQTS